MGIHGDTILLVLHDYSVSPFNPTNQPLHVNALSSSTGLQPAYVAQVCARLTQPGYVEPVGNGWYRITQQGADFSHTTPVIIERLRASGSLG
jgi:predicted transcriptional regulator of viral defense system